MNKDKASINIRQDSSTLDDNNFITDSRQFEIAQLGQKALTIVNVEEFMQELVKEVSNALGTEYVKILKLTPDKKRLRLIEGVGWKKGIVGKTFVEADYSSQAGYTLIKKQAVIVENFENETRFTAPELLIEHDVVSGMSITIPGKDGPYGVLGAHSKKEIHYSQNDVNYFQSVNFILSSVLIQQESIQEMRQEEEKYRFLMEYASDAIFISDLNGKILDVNAKACEITQYTKEELLSMEVRQLYSANEPDDTPLKFDELHVHPVIIERKFIKKDGSSLQIEANLKQLPNGTVQGICRDITSRKETEELIRNAQKMEAIGRLTGGIAHDFNNYLTVILGYAQKLTSVDINDSNIETVHSDAKQIQRIVEQASSLIKELLSFSRKKFYQTKVCNINKIVNDLDKSIVSFLGEQISLHFELAEDINPVKTNPNQLKQSMLNLIINAKDAIGSAKGNITIRTFNYYLEKIYESYAFHGLPGNYIGISIEDDGCGMSDEVKAHIFEPFFTAKEGDKGTGLGLASIYGFINEFNGFITVDSESQNGTTITLYLKALEEIDTSQDSQIKKSTKINKRNKIKNIVFVEDNEDLLDLFSILLEKNNYTVLQASNGKKALELILKNETKVDLIISDIFMPEMDGLELVNELTKLKIFKKTIMITGYTIKEKIHLADNVLLLQKPFTIEDLLLTINKIE